MHLASLSLRYALVVGNQRIQIPTCVLIASNTPLNAPFARMQLEDYSLLACCADMEVMWNMYFRGSSGRLLVQRGAAALASIQPILVRLYYVPVATRLPDNRKILA